MSTASDSEFRIRPRTLRRTTTQRITKQLLQIGPPSLEGLNKKGHLPSLEGLNKKSHLPSLEGTNKKGHHRWQPFSNIQ